MPRQKCNRLKKLRKVPLLVTGLIIFAVIFFCNLVNVPCATATGELNERQLVKITVVSGDTLWDLAKEYRPNYDGDIRALIHDIKDINGLKTAAINPGEILYIPMD